MKIVFLVRNLNYGGAERQLVALARGLHARGHGVAVVVFYSGGPLEPELRAAGIPVISSAKRDRWDVPDFLWRLGRTLRAERPDAVHGYLSASNTLSLLLKPLHGGRSVWGVRASDIDPDRYDWVARLDGFVEARLARFAGLVIANSHAGRDHALQAGFPAAKTIVIPNGVDTQRFRPDPASRAKVRAELGVTPDQRLVGRVGRIDPQKDYPTFLRAMATVAAARPEARFVVVGAGPEEQLAALRSLASELGLTERLTWAGARGDMPAVYGALDLAVSSSAYGEGTPNVVAEAMACGVPCVVTDVGDSAAVAGGLGEVVPRVDPAALAAATLRMLDRVDRGVVDPAALRNHVVQSLSLEALIDRTEGALLGLVAPARGGVREAGAR